MIGSHVTFDVTVQAPRERSHLGAFGKMSGLSGNAPLDLKETETIDCSQSPYFSVGFSRPVRFGGTSAILVCKSERDLGRVSKLPRGAGVGVSYVGEGKRRLPTPLPSPRYIHSLDTLPRLRSFLQTKVAAAPSKRTGIKNPTEK